MIMKFQEIIPAKDRLSNELSEIKGGLALPGATCDAGTVCAVGSIETGPIIIEEPHEPETFRPALG